MPVSRPSFSSIQWHEIWRLEQLGSHEHLTSDWLDVCGELGPSTGDVGPSVLRSISNILRLGELVMEDLIVLVQLEVSKDLC